MKKKSIIAIALMLALVTVLAILPASSMAAMFALGSNGTATAGSAAASKTATGVITASSWCNFRSGAGTGYAKVSGCEKLKKGYTVTVLNTVPTNKFYNVTYTDANGKKYTGWVSADYIKITIEVPGGTTGTGFSGLSGSGSSASAYVATGVITASSWCNFRSGAGTGYAKVSGCEKLKKGDEVKIVSLTPTDKFYNVIFTDSNGKQYKGWIHSDYIKINSGTSGSSSSGSSAGGLSFGLGGGSTASSAQQTAGGSTSSGSGIFGISSTGVSAAGGSSSGSVRYASYTGGSADRWGSMKIAGTSINDTIYCNALDSKGNFIYNEYSATKNYVYALSYLGDPISVIYGHNMRVAAKNHNGNDKGLHELHHIQNAWRGISKCECCGDSTSNCKTGVFDINYAGASKWQLCGFFELSSSTMSSASSRKNMEIFASMQSYRSGSALTEWINKMMGYCTSSYKGMKIADISASNKVMVIVTCADSSGNSNQRLYMILKAIG